jgi:hypothetical protein
MPSPHSKTELIAQLADIQRGLADTIVSASEDRLTASHGDSWSGADYLKHLILTIKPLAKALGLPPDRLRAMFGQPDHASRPYDVVVAAYQKRLDEGVRAEDYPVVVPAVYRMPDSITSLKDYLLDTWNDSNTRLLTALDNWDETDLDAYQLPHPAIGAITVREMLFFTIHHNTLHWHDIQAAVR